MRSTWLVLVLAGGCASVPVRPQDWYGQPRPTAALCSWDKAARWYDTGVLRAQGRGVPMAHWYPGGDPKRWDGATVTGKLKRVGPLTVLEGTWRGHGLIIDADVGASDEAVLFGLATVSVGRAGLLAKGASLRVVGAEREQPVVAPDAEALQVFTPVDRPEAVMACEALSLYPQDANALQWAGFDPKAPMRLLDVSAPVPVFERPEGEQVGTFTAGKEPLEVALLEQRGAWARIASEHRSGVVWHGWVRATLAEPTPGDLSNVFGIGGLGMAPRETWKACAVEQKVYAKLGGEPVWIGRMRPTTPFRLGAPSNGHAAVTFRGAGLSPVEGVELTLEASAAECGPWVEPEAPRAVLGALAPLEASPPEDPLADLMSGARVVPAMKDGTVVGFRLFGIRPGSFWQKTGFLNGDTLLRVGTKSILSADDTLAAMKTLATSEQPTDLEVERQGQVVKLRAAPMKAPLPPSAPPK